MKKKARPVVGRRGKSLLGDPGSELRLEREKEEEKVQRFTRYQVEGMGKKIIKRTKIMFNRRNGEQQKRYLNY